MDMSFALRSRRTFGAATPDLHALLSAAAVRQAMSLTARAHSQQSPSHDVPADPRIALFCGIRDSLGPVSARFADLSAKPVNSGQSS